jgi:hypothetical protein
LRPGNDSSNSRGIDLLLLLESHFMQTQRFTYIPAGFSTALLSVLIAGLLSSLVLADGASPKRSKPAPGEPTLDEVRAATARFQDVKVALAEGYMRDPGNMCETADMMGRPKADGGMGVHYFRPDLLGITGPPSSRVDGVGTHTDFRQPAVLIYEPQADGSMALIAVENLVFAKAWREAGHTAPPSFHGVPYDSMKDDPNTPTDEAHNFEPHFDRHVWIYRENPSGVFAQFNPTVSCAHHTATQTASAHAH